MRGCAKRTLHCQHFYYTDTGGLLVLLFYSFLFEFNCFFGFFCGQRGKNWSNNSLKINRGAMGVLKFQFLSIFARKMKKITSYWHMWCIKYFGMWNERGYSTIKTVRPTKKTATRRKAFNWCCFLLMSHKCMHLFSKCLGMKAMGAKTMYVSHPLRWIINQKICYLMNLDVTFPFGCFTIIISILWFVTALFSCSFKISHLNVIACTLFVARCLHLIRSQNTLNSFCFYHLIYSREKKVKMWKLKLVRNTIEIERNPEHKIVMIMRRKSSDTITCSIRREGDDHINEISTT